MRWYNILSCFVYSLWFAEHLSVESAFSCSARLIHGYTFLIYFCVVSFVLMTVCLLQLPFKWFWMDRNSENATDHFGGWLQLLHTVHNWLQEKLEAVPHCAAGNGEQVLWQTKALCLRSRLQINRLKQPETAWLFLRHKTTQINQVFELCSARARCGD